MANLKRDLFNTFKPDRPLLGGDPRYVNCQKVRGDGDICRDIGAKLILSDEKTCQLYTGHRGAGKSTELMRLKDYLVENRCDVVYFAADDEDIDPEDTQYTDILLCCTRRLLEALKESAKPTPLLNWLRSRWGELKDLATADVEFEKLSIEAQMMQFAKLTANLRAVPSLRQEIRRKVDPNTVTLIQALNEFIGEAKRNLPKGCTELVVIADNLDRIVPVPEASGRWNHEEIFVDRCEQLKALNCHTIYTVPISLAYSPHATNLMDIYNGNPTHILPMVMVKTPKGDVYPPGLKKVREIIQKRVEQIDPNLPIETGFFESSETLNKLCLMSGGHMRSLMSLLSSAISYTDRFPIPQKAIVKAITQARNNYRRAVEEDLLKQRNQWQTLAQVYRSKRMKNGDEYRSLLFNRCLLEYSYVDQEGEEQRWVDVNPMIVKLPEFQEAVKIVDR
jgi:AAA ATPase domain